MQEHKMRSNATATIKRIKTKTKTAIKNNTKAAKTTTTSTTRFICNLMQLFILTTTIIDNCNGLQAMYVAAEHGLKQSMETLETRNAHNTHSHSYTYAKQAELEQAVHPSSFAALLSAQAINADVTTATATTKTKATTTRAKAALATPTTTKTTTTAAAALHATFTTVTPRILHMRDSLSVSNEIDNSYVAAAAAAAAAAVAAVEADIAFEADVDVDMDVDVDVDEAGVGIEDDGIEVAEAGADYVMATTNQTNASSPTLKSTTAKTFLQQQQQQQRIHSKIQDLLSLSLLSSTANQTITAPATTAATTTTADKSASSYRNSVRVASPSAAATFQQIGTQKINALVPPVATAATVNIGNGASGSESKSQAHSHSHTHTHSKPNSNSHSHSLSKGNLATATTTMATLSAGSNKSNVRTSAKKVESKYILPKQQKTDAPMLNYIFDTFSSANKHHHHDQRYGPHFEDVQRLGQPTNMTVQAGSSIHLNCRISLLQDKTVSWVRRNALNEENALDLLTVGQHTYTGDTRYKMEFQYPNNWRLKITNVKKDDEAMFECQISTHPPRVIQINLHVNAPKVMIVDEYGDPLQEKYYEIDSTLQLSCVVRNVAMTSSVVFWKHGENILNYDVTRGGVSVKTELMEDGANSTLFIAKINKADSGNYTCSISDFQNFTIVVHILNGESFAELHHGGAAHATLRSTVAMHFLLLLLLYCCSAAFTYR